MGYARLGELLLTFGEILFIIGAIGLLSETLEVDHVSLLAAPAIILVGVGVALKHKGILSDGYGL